MARGHVHHVLDSKGRVAIPQGYRMELQAQDQRAPILAALIDQPALGLYARTGWGRGELGSLSGQPEIREAAVLISRRRSLITARAHPGPSHLRARGLSAT
jgi:DNA-binding transcriptional regulator/RsmH inhibitor MraZ